MAKVIQKFIEQLTIMLPLHDVKFRAKLDAAGLFSGNLKEEVKAKPTRAEMNEHFLDHGIQNNEDKFYTLLSVMEDFDCDSVRSLAREIRSKICSELGM